MIPTIVPIYAAIFAVMLVVLSVRVARCAPVRIAIGDGGNIILRRRIRVQGNFTEYVPLALLLLCASNCKAGRTGWCTGFAWCCWRRACCTPIGIAQEPEDIRLSRDRAWQPPLCFFVIAVVLLLYSRVTAD